MSSNSQFSAVWERDSCPVSVQSTIDNSGVAQRLPHAWFFSYEFGAKSFNKHPVNPNGVLIFHPDGHFALINMRSGRPPFASGNRGQGTEEENRTTARSGSQAQQ